MRLNILKIFSIFIATTTPFLAQGSLGFYNQIPDLTQVNGLKSQVYELFIPSAPLIVLKSSQLKGLDVDKMVIPAITSANKIKVVNLMITRHMITECQKTPDEDCYLYNNVKKGSAFLVGDDQTLYTAYHNIEGVVAAFLQQNLPETLLPTIQQEFNAQMVEKGKDQNLFDPFKAPEFMKLYKGFRKLKIPIVILNKDNGVVYGDLQQDATVFIDFRPELLLDPVGVPLKVSFRDFTRIKLNRPVGTPIPVAPPLPTLGEKSFNLGFPKSANRDQFQVPSSEGNSFYLTQGIQLSIDQISQRSGIQLINDDALELLSFCDCDGVFGFSGGPNVNKEGEVVFLIATVLPENQADVRPENIITFGPRMSYIVSYFEHLDEKLASH